MQTIVVPRNKQIQVCCSFPHEFMCRTPNRDTVLIVETPGGTFSAKSMLQNKRHTGARLISTNRLKLEEPLPVETDEVDPFSAARCRVYKRLNRANEVCALKYVAHKQMDALDKQ